MPNSKEGRPVAALFGGYFFYVGIFSPYLSLYFSARKFAVSEIAFLLSLTSVLRIIGPYAWGQLADHSQRPERLVQWAAFLMIPLTAALNYGAIVGDPFVNYSIILVLLFFVSSAFGPIGESLAVGVSGIDQGRYGRLRSFGSIGYIVAVIAMGPVLDAVGILSLPWWLFGASILLFLITLSLPRSVSNSLTQMQPIIAVLRRPSVVAFFASALLMVFAHFSLYTFYSLHLEKLGFSKTEIGLLWGAGVIAEILLFYVQHYFFSRYSLQFLALSCFVIAAVRFALIGVVGDSTIALVFVQLLHAATFALHHSASVGLLRTWFLPEQQARAQALYIVVAYGIGGTLGSLVLAVLWEQFNPAAVFYGAAVACLLGFACMYYSNLCAKRETEAQETYSKGA
jgi:MFS transporter, PPP family, 3-phenylpropionic acid transporter